MKASFFSGMKRFYRVAGATANGEPRLPKRTSTKVDTFMTLSERLG